MWRLRKRFLWLRIVLITNNHMMQVVVRNIWSQYKVNVPIIRQIVKDILSQEDHGQDHVSLKFCDNSYIHRVNRRYLNHDYATDVIAFAMHEGEDFPDCEDEEQYLGDCVVSVEMAMERAPDMGVTMHEELALYVIHGVLHLIGYDDVCDRTRPVMRDKETFYLKRAKPLWKERMLICGS